MDVHALGIGQEKACSGPVGNVLDMHQRQPLHAKGLKQFCRLQARLGAALQLHLAAGEVVVLDVDDNQGWFHWRARCEASILTGAAADDSKISPRSAHAPWIRAAKPAARSARMISSTCARPRVCSTKSTSAVCSGRLVKAR